MTHRPDCTNVAAADVTGSKDDSAYERMHQKDPAIPTDTSGVPAEPIRAGLLRRLGALFYDTLLLAAVLMVVTALFLPFTGGEAVTSVGSPVLEWLYRAALIGVTVLFFGTFWTRRGQTLGMASWRLRIEREDGARITWSDVVRRLAAAVLSLLPCGLGFAWILVDARKRAWHDGLSRTRVIVVPRK